MIFFVKSANKYKVVLIDKIFKPQNAADNLFSKFRFVIRRARLKIACQKMLNCNRVA